MDLVTLVTACALSVEPKLMHALIWHQSGGEPWAVAVQNEPMSRIYSSMQDAVSEVHSISIASDTVRVGLAGLPVSPLKANAAMFLPCRNVAIAAQRIARLSERCKKTSRSLGLSNLLRSCRLSRLLATTGCQIRGCGSNDRRERRRSQRRYAEGCQHRIARHWIRDATAVE